MFFGTMESCLMTGECLRVPLLQSGVRSKPYAKELVWRNVHIPMWPRFGCNGPTYGVLLVLSLKCPGAMQ